MQFLRSAHTLATAKLYLSSYRNALRAIDPNHPARSARKHRSGQRFSYLALTPEETRQINAAYHKEIHREQSELMPLDADHFVATALGLLDSERYTSIGLGLMALTGRRPAEIFFSASSCSVIFDRAALSFLTDLLCRSFPPTSMNQPAPPPPTGTVGSRIQLFFAKDRSPKERLSR
ncbi:MAG: protelomerase family protein [Chthoniobacterales bacterium]